MLENNDKVIVENRGNATCCYRVPDTNIIRTFVAEERKEISMGELRAATQIPGTRRVIKDNLIIHSKEAVEELLPEVEPEYFYTMKDVDFLLSRGTLDQLCDALDFAPEGVVSLIKDQAVNTELNDMRKREAILEQTGFNVTKAIEIKRLSEVKTESETKVRRSAPIGETAKDSAEVTAPVRRAAAPKYTVVK